MQPIHYAIGKATNVLEAWVFLKGDYDGGLGSWLICFWEFSSAPTLRTISVHPERTGIAVGASSLGLASILPSCFKYEGAPVGDLIH